MKKITLCAALTLGTGLLAACAPYPPGDCRYDNTCRNYPYDQNYDRNDRHRAGYIDENGNRYYLGTDGYYYRDPSYRGDRYYYREGYYYRDMPTPPGGWHRPTQPENHPDRY